MANGLDIAQLFSEMTGRFVPEHAEGITATVQFDLNGEDGGLYWLSIADKACEHGAGAVENADMTLIANAEDYQALATGELEPVKAFITGKLKVRGSMELALRMQKIFQLI